MTPTVSEGEQIERPEIGKTPARLASLDAYRGLVMLALAFDGAGPEVVAKFPNDLFLQALGRQFDHVDWEGAVFWDLIQPSFMFIVGVAMTYSYFSRRSQGMSTEKVAAHVIYRSLVLVLLGLLVASLHYGETQFSFGGILVQIGLAFPFAYLLVARPFRLQWIVAALILIGCWLAFFLFPLPTSTFDYASLGIPQDTGPFTGLYAHWNKYTNVAYAFDRWFLNLFPRSHEFLGNATYGPTLNFVPSIVTMLFGIMAGDLLRGPRQPLEKFLILCSAGMSSLALGLVVGYTLCPIVKALWTPSWVFFSAGFTFLFLAVAYWLADIKGWRALMFPLVVVGANSLAMYFMIVVCRRWIWDNLNIHLGGLLQLRHLDALDYLLGTFTMWLVCLWMYKHKIFIRL
jgi:heparan-alpha-glucosaminide N-acetyltransferase